MKSRPYPVGAVEINRRNPALCGGFSNPVCCGTGSFLGEADEVW